MDERFGFVVNKRVNGNIEVLRYIFTVIIAIMHFMSNFYGDAGRFSGGYLAVDFFFMLSGFFLAITVDKRSMGPFRFTFSKWFSMFWIYELSIFSMIGLETLENKWMASKIIFAIPDMLGLQMSGFFYPNVNGILWYVSAMLIAGFFIAFMYKKYKSNFVNLIGPAIMLAGYALVYHSIKELDGVTQESCFIPLGLIRAYAGISTGVVLRYIYELMEKDGFFNMKNSKFIMSFAEAAAIAVLGICMFLKPHTHHDFKCLLCFPVIIVSAYSGCTLWGRVSDIIGNGLTKVFGKQYTLCLYAFSIAVYKAMKPFMDSAMRQTKTVIIYLAVLVPVCFVITKISEVLSKHVKIRI